MRNVDVYFDHYGWKRVFTQVSYTHSLDSKARERSKHHVDYYVRMEKDVQMVNGYPNVADKILAILVVRTGITYTWQNVKIFNAKDGAKFYDLIAFLDDVHAFKEQMWVLS